MNFTDYIHDCKVKIRQAKPDASETVIDWNAPFILKPDHFTQKGILLIHGLLDSCFAMREIGQVFQTQGYLVYAILLPGHGTKPDDLVSVSYKDWLQTVEFGIQALKQEVTDISIAGFSLGAALALYYAGIYPNTIKKIYCLAPACQIKSKFVFLTGFISCLGKVIRALTFLKKVDEDDCVKYKTMAINAAWQIYKITQKIKHLRLKIPLFFAISEQDETVSFHGALSFFKRQTNPDNIMLIFSNQKYLIDKKIIDKQIMVLRSDLPEKNILCLSHHGMIYSPNNPYYGEQGAYTLQNINRYHADYYGNVFIVKKLKNGKSISRLFYNPSFYELIKKF